MANKDGRMSGNKGEWSELYAFMKLLSQGRVYAANEKVEKIDEVYYPILRKRKCFWILPERKNTISGILKELLLIHARITMLF